MKRHSKTMIVATCFVVASLSSAAVSSLAWFNLTRTVSMSYSSISINGNYGHLRVSIDSISDSSAYIDKTSNSYSEGIHETLISSKSVTQDVSSKDGQYIYAPVWAGSSANNGKVDHVLDVTMDYNYYTLFRFTVTNPGDTPLQLFAANGTAITAVDYHSEADRALADSTRVALVEVSQNYYDQKRGDAMQRGETKMVFEKRTESNTESFISGTALNDDATLKLGSYEDTDVNHVYLQDFKMPTINTPHTSKQYLGEMSPYATRYYYGAVWLEGTEVDNQNDCDRGSVSISLSFVGVEPEE